MSTAVEDKRALEALRNGVPNRAAIRALGCAQPAIETAFRSKLQQSGSRIVDAKQEPGFLIEGDFGSGKSHVLGYLAEIALENNFVCSRVVVSKETPLHDTAKVFRAAIESAVLPDAHGLLMEELETRLSRRKSSAEYVELYEWATGGRSGLWPGFGATLKLWENPPDDAGRAILDFWSGQPLAVAPLRRWLRARNLDEAFQVPSIKRPELNEQRPRFASRLFHAAGYRGWVILLDEVELIGRYSALQRARSYSELARWLGLSDAAQSPGMVTVAAITEDFQPLVFMDKQDRELASERLRGRGDNGGAARAELGMQAILKALTIRPPGAELLDHTYATLKDLHGRAYNWAPPELARPPGRPGKRMRAFVREWITNWDLGRFYPQQDHEVEQTDLSFPYAEDADFMSSTEGDDLTSPEATGGDGDEAAV